MPTFLQLHTQQPVTGENEALSAQGKRKLSLSEVNEEPQPSETLPAKTVNITGLSLSENTPTFESQASSLISPFSRSSLLTLFLFLLSSQTKRAILQQLREMDTTKTLCKKFAVFGFYPDTEEDDGHGDGDDEMPQDLPSFTPLIHLCEAISEGFSPTPRISALNLPLGVMIEVLDENLCNVVQGTLRLRARALVTFLADVVGHHELIEFAQPPVSIKVNAVSPEVPENFGVPPLGDYLKEIMFRGVVLDFIGGSSPSISVLTKFPGALYPVAVSDTAIDLSELKAGGITHFIDKQALYCCWEAPNRGELDNAELPTK